MADNTLQVFVAAFGDEKQAASALQDFRAMDREGSIELIDAVVVVRDAEGKVTYEETADPSGKRWAKRGAIAGGLVGLLFPPSIIAGAVVGGAGGGIWGKVRDKGFKDDDLKAIGDSLEPGTSAIIAIAQDQVVERLVRGLEGYQRIARHAVSAEACSTDRGRARLGRPDLLSHDRRGPTRPTGTRSTSTVRCGLRSTPSSPTRTPDGRGRRTRSPGGCSPSPTAGWVPWATWTGAMSSSSAAGRRTSPRGWLAGAPARSPSTSHRPSSRPLERCQEHFGLTFPLVEASADDVPLPDDSFDLAVSEYGASVWCDPERWIAEAARLLRPGGRLVFLTNSVLVSLCVPEEGGYAGEQPAAGAARRTTRAVAGGRRRVPSLAQ